MKLTFATTTLRFQACLGAVAALGIFGATATSHAAVTTYTSQAAFFNALQDPAYFEGFNEFSGQVVASPQSFALGPLGFTLSDNDPAGIYYSTGTAAEGSVFPTVNSAGESFTLTFTGNVTAVGGTFFLTDINFTPIAGASVTATLATGQTIVLASTASYGTEPFGGFTSTTPITSLTLSAPAMNTGGTFVFNTLDNLIISGTAAVPEPGTWALLASGGAVLLFTAARRRLA